MITAAAILNPQTGTIYSLPKPHRHPDIMIHFNLRVAEMVYGFLTDDWQFLSREKAYKVAKENNQIIKSPEVVETPGTLYTEDLW